MSQEVKRYDPLESGVMIDYHDGDYVLYADHIAAMAELEAEIEQKKTHHDELVTEVCKKFEVKDKKIDELQAKLDKAIEALKFYGDEMNYSVDDYHGISGEMRTRCVLYKDCEERNDVYSYAGKLARKTLAELTQSEEK